MLNYDFIFKKGILFIRLKGEINEKTGELFNKEINPLILDNGIKEVVINVSKLKSIDKYGIKVLYDSYLRLRNESDISICEIPIFLRNKFKNLLKHIKEREDEYTILTKN